jgi:large subunit ribosomal protein L13
LAKTATTVINADGAVMGRLATKLAKRLLEGETIVVVNAEKAKIIGTQKTIKARYTFKVEVGTERKGPYHPRMPHMILKRTVRGMLPYQQPRGRSALKRLICHIGVPDEFKDAKIEVVEGALKPQKQGMTLLEVARFLGKNIEVSS